MKRLFWQCSIQFFLIVAVLLALGAGAGAAEPSKDASQPPAAANRPGDVGWFREVVDSTGDVGQWTSLAYDTLVGLPHITYYDATNHDLKYAVKASWGWSIGTVDGLYDDTDVGQYSSLALDSSYGQYISYYDATNKNLKYAYSDGGPWQIQTVDSDGDVGSYTSITLLPDGRPCISYWESVYWMVKLACKQPGGWWQTQNVDQGNHLVGPWSSVGVDAAGNPVVAYYLRLDPSYAEGLTYYYWNGAMWWWDEVDVANTDIKHVGQYNSLRMYGGLPRISYYDFTNYALKYAAYSGGVWSTEVVDPGPVNFETSLALNSYGDSAISYYDSAADSLKFAQKIAGYWWDRYVVDGSNGDKVGRYSSLAYDAYDVPHIAYYDETHGDLKFAYSIWVQRTYLPIVNRR